MDSPKDVILLYKESAFWFVREDTIRRLDGDRQIQTVYILDNSFDHNGFDTADQAYSYLAHLAEEPNFGSNGSANA